MSDIVMPETKIESYPVTGMACAACAASVQSLLGSQAGVSSASVNYGNKTLRIEYDPSTTTIDTLRKTIQSIGYDILTEDENRPDKLNQLEHRRKTVLLKRLMVAVIFSVPLFLFSMVFHHAFTHQDYLLLFLSLPVIIYSGAEFYPSAIRQARHGIFTMDSLVTTGTGAAFLLSFINTLFPGILESQGITAHVYYETAAIIITFILVGRYLEERVKARASSAIRKLTGLQPKKIKVQRDGELFEIPAALVVPGDVVTVRLGDRVPVDGEVVKGNAAVDESVITGEPFPVAKESGSRVYAGTLNRQGLLVVEAKKPGNDTLLMQIIMLVNEAQSSKPPIQQHVDKIAAIFVPTVFIISAVTFLAWTFIGHSPGHAFVTTISVLVIACPCALGLATPMALIAGIGRGATMGMIIRNAQALENACNIDTVVFDKTGTITSGKPSLSFEWLSEKETYIPMLYQAEKQSGHPLAATICSFIEEHYPLHNLELPAFDHLEEIPGKGLNVTYAGVSMMIGNSALLATKGIDTGEPDDPGDISTLVYVTAGNAVIAKIAVSDSLKSGSRQAVDEFKAMNISTVLVTGDSEKPALFIAGMAGISEVYHSVLPDRKGEIISKYQKDGKKVAMIGDGINDAYALAQADLGIAMGNGTEAAIDSAGIILMKPELTLAVSAIRLSRKVVRIIHQNLFWAFFYNIIAIPLAAGILYPVNGFLLNPMIAGAAMALSSLTVVMNSLRLKKIKV